MPQISLSRKSIIVACGIVLVLIVSLGFYQPRASADDKGPYLVQSKRFPTDADLQAALNAQAKDGWMYVASIQTADRLVLVFKK